MLIQHLIQCSASSPFRDTLKNLAAVAVIPVSLLTFWLGYRQKERERTLAYYHKVVVDVVLPDVFSFFSDQVVLLDQAGRDALAAIATKRKTFPRSCTVALGDFAKGLFDLQNKITERTIIFDEKVTTKIELLFEEIQDGASEWFDAVSQYKRRNEDELTAVLRRGQRSVIKQLYKGQFRDF